jgi:hypothetical protein
MTAVRDEVVTVYREDGLARARLSDPELVRLIAEDLGLAALPVREAVAAWRAATELAS